MHCDCMCCGFESRHSPDGYDGMVDMSGLDFDEYMACVGSSPTTRKKEE